MAIISKFQVARDNLSDDELARRRQWHKIVFEAAPSWTVSLLLHTILIVVLAMINLDPLGKVLSIIEVGNAHSEVEAIGEFSIQAPPLELPQPAELPITVPQSDVVPSMELAQFQDPTSSLSSTVPDELSLDALTESVLPRNILQANTLVPVTSMLSSRSLKSKSEMLEKYGGNAESEKAVAKALKWLAQFQVKRGRLAGSWNFSHVQATRNSSTGPGEFIYASNGATALSLLPFLGAGQTHLEGQYKETVKAGLAYLINSMKVTNHPTLPYGSWHEPQGNMYSHGLAAIAVCEAYAMTQDPDLLQPAQLAINYLIYAQDPREGGWRYEPKQPGDTSVVGWCLMALKSGSMGRLTVPPATFAGASRFLDFAGTNQGAFYGYDKPSATKLPGTTAVGLLCRMYLGWPKEHPGLENGVTYLNEHGPQLTDLYFSYYATQVMRHHGGQAWQTWNGKMRGLLVESQIKEGNDAGSWDPQGNHTKEGGRLYQTALATMILEVYYRHLPLYSEQSLAEEDFEL